MFDLIADIERYPLFLPWCAAARIVSSLPEGLPPSLEADLTVAFPPVKETYRSHVTLDRAQGLVTARHIRGPFKHLVTEWRLTALGDGGRTQVDCTVEFSFRNPALQMMLSLVFGRAVARMAEAFEARARMLYGRKAVSASAAVKSQMPLQELQRGADAQHTDSVAPLRPEPALLGDGGLAAPGGSEVDEADRLQGAAPAGTGNPGDRNS